MLAVAVVLCILVFIFFGMPLFAGLAALTVSLYFFSGGTEALIAIFLDPYSRLTANDLLVPIPLFTMMGFIIAKSQAPGRIVLAFQSLARLMAGGRASTVGVMAVLVSALFTPFTGASGITIVALGGVLMPILRKAGYTRKLSLGIVTSSGSLGLLFFPSVPVILYGIVSNNKAPIPDLFIAGIIPGLLLILLPSLYLIFFARITPGGAYQKNGAATNQKIAPAETRFRRLFWEVLFLPAAFFLFLWGYITITEIGALGLAYYSLLEVFLFKEIPRETWPAILAETFAVTGGVLIVVFFAMGLTGYMLDESIPQRIFQTMQGHISSKWAFLIMLNIFLLGVGAVLDIFSAILVIAPIVIPIAEMFGVNMVHLGILFLTNLEIGYITPPVGINLFLSSFRFEEPVPQVYRSVWPFFLVLLFAQILITYIPWLSLWLGA